MSDEDRDSLSVLEAPQSEADGARAPVMSQARIFTLLHALLRIIAASDEPVYWQSAFDELKAQFPPTEAELTQTNSGRERYTHYLQWWSVDLTKAGWLRKGPKRGYWLVTDEGRRALSEYRDPQRFGAAMFERSREVMRRDREQAAIRKKQSAVRSLAAVVPAGSWTTFAEIARATQWPSEQVGTYLWGERPYGWHRVLGGEGTTRPEPWQEWDRSSEQADLLTGEGLLLDPHAPTERRLDAHQLRALLGTDLSGDRAWLVRGSNVEGINLVNVWLERGFISRPATGIVPPALPVRREGVEAAVAAATVNRSSDYTRRRVEEYDRFLRRMAIGDFVLTTADGVLYLGRIEGDPQWVDEPGLPARLRREVSWITDTDGVEFQDLPAPLPDRLATPEDVADMTLDYAAIASLVPTPVDPPRNGTGRDGDNPPPPPPPPPFPGLPTPTEELAKRLFLDLDWLVRLTTLLERRNQVILYGPPGTGKTFIAQALAEHLTEAGHVRVVQFHPSFTYEDFIAGYRPVEVDGVVAFRLRQGPLMQIAEQARDNPSTPYVLIIDEINRANLAKVFGELYFLLEYRDRSIDLLYADEGAETFSLPRNLFIIGTMNTADRSIALVDAAMRRRFAFRELHPHKEPVASVLPRWLAAKHPGVTRPARLLSLLNEQLAAHDYAIGPSYFMKAWIHSDGDEGLREVWESDILPLLAEHHAGEDIDVEARYSLDTFLSEVGAEPGSVEVNGDDAADEVGDGEGSEAVD